MPVIEESIMQNMFFSSQKTNLFLILSTYLRKGIMISKVTNSWHFLPKIFGRIKLLFNHLESRNKSPVAYGMQLCLGICFSDFQQIGVTSITPMIKWIENNS